MHLVGDHEGLLSECSASLPGVEMTEIEAHMATYSLFATDHRWQVAHRQYRFNHDSGGVASGKGHA